MRKKSRIKKGLSFQDVILEPGCLDISPDKIDVTTCIATNFLLKVPIVSAAMDKVTGPGLAIAIAQCGGLGFLPHNCPIDVEVEWVKEVKKSQGSVVTNPICVSPEISLIEVDRLSELHGISRFPVLNGNGNVVGIVSEKYCQLERVYDLSDYSNLRVKDVMQKNIVTVPEGIGEKEALGKIKENNVSILPIVDKDGKLKGIWTRSDFIKRGLSPNATRDKKGRLMVAATVGTAGDYIERALELVNVAEVDFICAQVAHIFNKCDVEAIKKLREVLPDKIPLIAGNVVNYNGAIALLKVGVCTVVVGLGPGSTCITRVVSGVGVPQITAIMEVYRGCEEYAEKNNLSEIPSVIADGGIKYSGDIPKALAAGAGLVMIGGLFSGTDESPGEIVYREGKRFKEVRGMGSLPVIGTSDRYTGSKVPQGVEGIVPYEGSLKKLIDQLVGGLKSGMVFTGSRNIASLKNVTFIEVTSEGEREGHPSIIVTKAPPNYPL